MLKLRILTAIVLLALLFAAIYILPVAYFPWIVGVFVLIGAWEWSALSGLKSKLSRVSYVVLVAFIYLMLSGIELNESIEMLSGMAALWWAWSFIWLLRYQRQIKVIEPNKITFSLLGILVLIPFWFATVILNLEQKINPEAGQLLLYVIVLVALSDTSAYFVGRKWGKHKLASKISPGKSWEGFLGAVFIVTFLSWPLAEILQVKGFTQIELIVIALIMVVAGVLGDLFESLMKRIAGVKDSGKILPGHGGVLDRIDAYTAAIPIFMAIYFYW